MPEGSWDCISFCCCTGVGCWHWVLRHGPPAPGRPLRAPCCSLFLRSSGHQAEGAGCSHPFPPNLPPEEGDLHCVSLGTWTRPACSMFRTHAEDTPVLGALQSLQQKHCSLPTAISGLRLGWTTYQVRSMGHVRAPCCRPVKNVVLEPSGCPRRTASAGDTVNTHRLCSWDSWPWRWRTAHFLR